MISDRQIDFIKNYPFKIIFFDFKKMSDKKNNYWKQAEETAPGFQ